MHFLTWLTMDRLDSTENSEDIHRKVVYAPVPGVKFVTVCDGLHDAWDIHSFLGAYFTFRNGIHMPYISSVRWRGLQLFVKWSRWTLGAVRESFFLFGQRCFSSLRRPFICCMCLRYSESVIPLVDEQSSFPAGTLKSIYNIIIFTLCIPREGIYCKWINHQ